MSRAPCARVQHLLSAHVDGRLPARTSRAMNLHLARCGECQRERDALERLGRLVADWPREAPEPGLAERVRARATGRGRAARALRRIAGLAAAALVVVGLALAYELGRRQGRGGPPVAPSGVVPSGVAPGAHRLVREPAAPPSVEPTPSGVRAAPDLGPSVAPSPEPPLPPDHLALRASRALFADLGLLDAVPAELCEALVRAQFERYDLSRWAAARRDEEPYADVATLVSSLARELERGLPRAELASLRADAGHRDLWAPAFESAPAAVDFAPRVELDALLERVGTGLSPATRTSLGRWLEYRDGWVRGSDDLGPLLGLLDELAPVLEAGSRESVLPDLRELFDRIEWSEDGDGTRRGWVEVERRGGSRRSFLRVEVHTLTLERGPR